MHVRHERAYVLATGAVPHVDPELTIPDAALDAQLGNRLVEAETGGDGSEERGD